MWQRNPLIPYNEDLKGITMPTPNPGESQKDFVSRAVKMMMSEEGLTQSHALGKAYGMYRQHQKKQKPNDGPTKKLSKY